MKNFTIIFSSLAVDDVEQAVDYYEEQQVGLGQRFAGQVGLALISIRRNPYFASIRYNDIRCAQVKKFPYLVHYHIDENKYLVSILSVYATHREPLG